MGINSETRAFHNAVCDLIKGSSLPSVNIELVLSIILRDVSAMTNAEIEKEGAEENETRYDTNQHL